MMHTMVTRCVEVKDGVSNFKVRREVPALLNQSRFHQGHRKRTVMSGIVLPLGSHTFRTTGVIIARVHGCKKCLSLKQHRNLQLVSMHLHPKLFVHSPDRLD